MKIKTKPGIEDVYNAIGPNVKITDTGDTITIEEIVSADIENRVFVTKELDAIKMDKVAKCI